MHEAGDDASQLVVGVLAVELVTAFGLLTLHSLLVGYLVLALYVLNVICKHCTKLLVAFFYRSGLLDAQIAAEADVE